MSGIRFKASTKRSDVTDVLTFEDKFFDGFVITVRALSRKREEMLNERATVNGKVDEEQQALLFAEECVAGWTGFKPDHLEALVGDLEEATEQPEIVDGCIPYSVEMAAFLMLASRPLRFSLPVLAMARALQQANAEKKRRSELPSDA